MTQKEILKHVKGMIRRYNALDNETRNENKGLKLFLTAVKNGVEHNTLDCNAIWHPAAIFDLAHFYEEKSIATYHEKYGYSLDLVEGCHTMTYYDPHTNDFKPL
jgi:hypothetical protein